MDPNQIKHCHMNTVRHFLLATRIYIGFAVEILKMHIHKCDRPAKRDQVGTEYTISQNGTYLEFCVQYLLSVSCVLDGRNFIYIDVADH